MVEISPAPGHVHGAVRAGGHILVGTRDGVNRVDPATCRLERVGESRDDLMAFMGDPSSLLLASDRPGPGSDMVNPLGLMTSTDGGDSWRAVSLGGPVDFHAMAENGDQVIGWITRGPLQSNGPDPRYRTPIRTNIGQPGREGSGIREFGNSGIRERQVVLGVCICQGRASGSTDQSLDGPISVNGSLVATDPTRRANFIAGTCLRNVNVINRVRQ